MFVGEKGGALTGSFRSWLADRALWKHQGSGRRGTVRGRLKHWSRCRGRKKRPWRHQIGGRYGRREKKLRRILMVVLAAEAGWLVGVSGKRMEIRLIRQDEQWQTEWISPGEAFGSSQDGDSPTTVYGIRICPETLEIQFYSRSRSIRDH